ncbi:MAG: putative Ig domain-containing protein [Gemmatimonadota bacterium]
MMQRWFVLRFLLVAAPSLLFLSCGDGGTSAPADPVVQVTVTPTSAEIATGSSTTFGVVVVTEGGENVSASVTVTWTVAPADVATVQGSGATAQVTGLAEGAATVRATVGRVVGQAVVTVFDPTPPAAPTGVTAVAASDTEIDVAWQDNSSDETSFRIEREQTVAPAAGEGGPARVFAEVTSVGPGATSFHDSGLERGTAYRYLVRACNEHGCSPAEGSPGEEASESDVVLTHERLSLLTTSLPRGTLGQEYDAPLEAEGGNGSYEWDLSSGGLPAGLQLLPEGAIRGTPDETGSFTLGLRVRSGGQSASRTIGLIVTAPEGAAHLETEYLVSGNVGVPYVDRLSATGEGSLTFSVVAGGLPEGVTLDGATGDLTGTPTGSGLSYFTIRVQAGTTNDRRTFALHISPNPPGAFNVWTMNVSTDLSIPSPAIVDAVADALAKWEDVIVGDLPATSYPPGFWQAGDCNGNAQSLNGQGFDDMLVMLQLVNIDGPGQTLGSAGPCSARTGATGLAPDVYTTFGRLRLDTSDLDDLDDDQLFALVFHEIGHIVGIGTLWEASEFFGGSDLITGSDGPNPRYTGEGGNAEYSGTLGGGSGGAGRAPIEADGGEGTAYGHWDEGEFDNEMMTGYIEPSGRPIPISSLTVAAVGDFAYEVDLEASDPYSIPGCAPGCTAAPPWPSPATLKAGRRPLDDIRRGPIAIELPSGEVVFFTPPGGNR